MTPAAIILLAGMPMVLVAFTWEYIISPVLARRRIVRAFRRRR